MSDIVEAALEQREERIGHGQVQWTVNFVNGETRGGTIGILGDGNYALIGINTIYYFAADKVAFMSVAR